MELVPQAEPNLTPGQLGVIYFSCRHLDPKCKALMLKGKYVFSVHPAVP